MFLYVFCVVCSIKVINNDEKLTLCEMEKEAVQWEMRVKSVGKLRFENTTWKASSSEWSIFAIIDTKVELSEKWVDENIQIQRSFVFVMFCNIERGFQEFKMKFYEKFSQLFRFSLNLTWITSQLILSVDLKIEKF